MGESLHGIHGHLHGIHGFLHGIRGFLPQKVVELGFSTDSTTEQANPRQQTLLLGGILDHSGDKEPVFFQVKMNKISLHLPPYSEIFGRVGTRNKGTFTEKWSNTSRIWSFGEAQNSPTGTPLEHTMASLELDVFGIFR